MSEINSNRSVRRPGCLGAGGTVWYTILALGFLACSLNPVGIAALALGILKPHDVYTTPLGSALTASSFMIALMGFIATERVAYLERHRRALELASLAACGAAVLAFVLGFTLPVIIMWPIAAVLIAIGGFGFRGAARLPVPGAPAAATAPRTANASGTGGGHDPGRAPQSAPGRKRHRRRRRKPRRSSPPGISGD
jgi:hypothetical protein